MNNSQNIPDDDSFTIETSHNMELRNALRTGLVTAQGKDTDKIPLFVSWPEWLEDGIVCIYARDFKHVISSAICDTAVSINAVIESFGTTEKSPEKDDNGEIKNGEQE